MLVGLAKLTVIYSEFYMQAASNWKKSSVDERVCPYDNSDVIGFGSIRFSVQ